MNNTNTRHNINWDVLDRRIKTLGMTPASLSRAIGRSSGFYSSMKIHNNMVSYEDACKIANTLGIHGTTKFTIKPKQTELDASDKPIVSEIKIQKPRETETKVMTRIADALERIADALEGRSEPWQLSL